MLASRLYGAASRDVLDTAFHIAAGAGVGLAIGLTGVGGGSLMTPLLLLFGYPLHVAIGTDLLYAAITKAGGMAAHGRRGNVDWRIVRRLALGSIPASLLTVLALHTVFGDAQAYAPLLTTALGVMLVLTAGAIALRPAGPSHETDAAHTQPSEVLPAPATTGRAGITVAVGVLLGICVTLSSVGAGAFGAAVLLMLYPALRSVRVVGSDVAHAVPLTLVAGLGHLALGNVDFGLLAALIVGSLPAIWFGARLAERVPDGILRPALAALLALLGVRFALF